MAKTELEVRVDTAMANGTVHPHALRCLEDGRRNVQGLHMFDYGGEKYCTGEFYCPMSEPSEGDGFPYCRRMQYARDVASRNQMTTRNPHRP